MSKKKQRFKKYALIRDRYKDSKFLYSDILRKFNDKNKAEILLQAFESEYSKTIRDKNILFSDKFYIKKI